MNTEPLSAQARYSTTAMWLHWIIAALIIGNWLGMQLGETHLPDGSHGPNNFMPIHMATGIIILALSLVRLGWRITHKPPASPSSHKPWEQLLAKVTHWIFYLLMIGIPLSGWIAKSTGKYFDKPIDMYGVFNVPSLPFGMNEGLHELGEVVHEAGLTLLQLLVILHLAGAIKHWLVDKDGSFRRIWFGGKPA